MVSTGILAGSVSLDAEGVIYMTGITPVATDMLSAVSGYGMFLGTEVRELDAHLAQEGILEIRETEGIVLSDVTNADGPIRVIAGGEMTAIRVESLTDEKGNNIGLMTLDGDIRVDYVGAGAENGQISLSSAGDIREVNEDPEVDLSGALGILYAQGKIDKGIEANFKSTHGHGKKQALYEFERGKKLNIGDLKGDVELFFTLENKVHVVADGAITVTYLDSGDNDVDLKSRGGDIHIEYLDAGPGRGDVKLQADGSVHLAAQGFSGDTGRITTGGDLDMDADEGIELYGIVAAGDDIRMNTHEGDVVIAAALTAGDDLDIHSGGDILISGSIIAGGDIHLHARHGAVVIEAAVAAGDDLEIHAGEDLVVSAPLAAGGDLDLYAEQALITTSAAAVLIAGGNVKLKTRRGDIVLWGAIESGNGFTPSNHKHCSWHKKGPDVLIDSGSNLYIYGAVNSVDDVEIRADDDFLIDAAVTAGDDIDIHGNGGLTVTAFLTAGGDIDLYAKGLLSVGGAVSAGDDVQIDAGSDVHILGNVRAGDDVKVDSRGDITVKDVTVEAGDRIEMSARGDLTLMPGYSLTGIDGGKARLVKLSAKGELRIDDTSSINADRVIMH
jgi:hypothetical protein